MKPITLKESEISEEETLDHCLTVIQGILDMDDYSQAYKYLYCFTKCLIAQTREETIKEILSQLRLKLRNTYKAEDIADTAFLTESDLESVLNK